MKEVTLKEFPRVVGKKSKDNTSIIWKMKKWDCDLDSWHEDIYTYWRPFQNYEVLKKEWMNCEICVEWIVQIYFEGKWV